MKRSTFHKWEQGDARVTAMPEALDGAGGTKLTGFVIGVDQNPMSREQLVELGEIIAAVLEESPAPIQTATLDVTGGIVA